MATNLYWLTDGQEVYETRIMTSDMADLANGIASETTDGNVWWEVVPDWADDSSLESIPAFIHRGTHQLEALS